MIIMKDREGKSKSVENFPSWVSVNPLSLVLPKCFTNVKKDFFEAFVNQIIIVFIVKGDFSKNLLLEIFY